MKKQTSIKAEKGFLNPKISNIFIEGDQQPLFRSMSKDILHSEFSDSSDIEDFLKQTDFNINQVDQKSSTKTNFYILNNNWIAVVKYLKNLKSVVKWIYDNMRIDEIVDSVLEKLEVSKKEIPISFDMPVTTSYQVVSGKHTYKITRADLYVINIECLTKKQWEVRNIMVTVKNNDNIIVYPAIQTTDNKIRIDFIDKISTNYRVIFI